MNYLKKAPWNNRVFKKSQHFFGQTKTKSFLSVPAPQYYFNLGKVVLDKISLFFIILSSMCKIFACLEKKKNINKMGNLLDFACKPFLKLFGIPTLFKISFLGISYFFGSLFNFMPYKGLFKVFMVFKKICTFQDQNLFVG